MKTKQNAIKIISFIIILILISCKNPENETHINAMDDRLDIEALDSQNKKTSINKMDWTGVYRGTLPCADCEGIETTIVLNDDNTYQKTSKYLKGETPSEFEESGVYEFDKNREIIILIPEENQIPGQSKLYQLEENQLRFLNPEGEKIEGEMADLYVLRKL